MNSKTPAQTSLSDSQRAALAARLRRGRTDHPRRYPAPGAGDHRVAAVLRAGTALVHRPVPQPADLQHPRPAAAAWPARRARPGPSDRPAGRSARDAANPAGQQHRRPADPADRGTGTGRVGSARPVRLGAGPGRAAAGRDRPPGCHAALRPGRRSAVPPATDHPVRHRARAADRVAPHRLRRLVLRRAAARAGRVLQPSRSLARRPACPSCRCSSPTTRCGSRTGWTGRR